MSGIGRRELLGVFGSAAALPIAAQAQQPSMRAIGLLDNRAAETTADRLRGFHHGLRESGFPDCVVYNYSLYSEWASSQHYSERVAQRWLTAAAMAWRNQQVYPNPGDHCRCCQQPCLVPPAMFSRYF